MTLMMIERLSLGINGGVFDLCLFHFLYIANCCVGHGWW